MKEHGNSPTRYTEAHGFPPCAGETQNPTGSSRAHQHARTPTVELERQTEALSPARWPHQTRCRNHFSAQLCACSRLPVRAEKKTQTHELIACLACLHTPMNTGETEKEGLLRKLCSKMAPAGKGPADMKWYLEIVLCYERVCVCHGRALYARTQVRMALLACDGLAL